MRLYRCRSILQEDGRGAIIRRKCLQGKLGRELGCHLSILGRVKKTLPQKLLDDAGRQNNLKRAFKINRNDVKLKRVIIVDDIYTTGSTIDACAVTLKRAGVEKVYFITVAIGKELL